MTIAPPFSKLPVTFLGSFPDPVHRLEPVLPEFAFVGRSNVGKSSLLNALTGRRALARVSATPGKTQLLNIFQLPTFYMIDLPGYGWAKASQSSRAEYRKLLEDLLKTRDTLTGVVWLLDVRHSPSADDVAFQALLAEAGRSVLVVLTKSDKLGRKGLDDAVRDRSRELGLALDQIQVVSSSSGSGIADLGESLLAAAGGTE